MREIQLSTEQQKVYEEAMAGSNMVILGGAGTGKSTLVQVIKKSLEQQGKKVEICAATGVAARTANGQTIHSLFGLSIGVQNNCIPNRQQINRISDLDVLIIDEISMCRRDSFAIMIRCCEQAPKNIQIIAVGDYYQLPPFIESREKQIYKVQWHDENKIFAMQSEEWDKLQFKVFELKESQRQKEDKDFAEALNKVAKGNIDGARWIENNCSSLPYAKGVYLYATRKKVNERNKKELSKIASKEVVFYEERRREGEIPVPSQLILKVSARVMCVINIPNTTVVNGSMGTVIAIDAYKKIVKVCMDDGYVAEFIPYEFGEPVYDQETGENLGTNVIATQIPLVLAYALTINKSQSLTMEKVNVDPACFASGQLYTALSRVRNVEDIHLLHAIEKKDLIVDPRVQEFYEKIDADVNKCLPYEEYSHIVECIPLHLGLDEDFFPEPMVANY